MSVGGSVAFDYIAKPFQTDATEEWWGRTCVPALTVARKAAACGRLPAMSLLTDLDAFFTEHGRCGDLDGGVDGPIVWFACDCGASMAARLSRNKTGAECLHLTPAPAPEPTLCAPD